LVTHRGAVASLYIETRLVRSIDARLRVSRRRMFRPLIERGLR
jgi:hypothetical protein